MMRYLFLCIVILLSFSVQAMTGFGSIIIAVTLGSLFFPIKSILPILVLLDFSLNMYIVTRYRKHVDYALLVKKILPAMLIGLLAGQVVFNTIGAESKRLFGGLIVFLSVFELYNFYTENTERLTHAKSFLFLIGAGIIHGIYASGGPLVVYVIGRLGIGKATFRSTLGFLWVIMDSFLMASYLLTGILNYHVGLITLFIAPVVMAGLVIGEVLHVRINEKGFKKVIYYLLLFTGLSILIFG